MLYNYINGYDLSVVRVVLNNQTIESFTLPIEDVNGKKENVQDDLILHKLITGELKQFYKGTRISWDIPYVEAASIDTCVIMEKLRNYRNSNAGYQFFLKPNRDIQREFEVLLSGESINLGIERAEENAEFSTGIAFSFVTKYYSNTNWINKNNIPYMGIRNFFRIGIF